VTVEFIADSIYTPNKSAYLSCLNLERLGIIEHTGYRPPDKHPIADIFEDSMEQQEYRITEYGIALDKGQHSGGFASRKGICVRLESTNTGR